jgi:predicted lipoprotein with Yx(FWY)xxD motif
MTRVPLTATAALVSIAALALSACGGGSNASSPAPPKTPDGHSATVGVANNSQLGKILDNPSGRTLYLFAKDSGDTSACTGACASAWPPLRVTGKPTVGSGAKAADVATIKRPDGRPQVTYNGHPLYTYSGDTSPGQTNGQGLNAFGGGWFALSPAGTQVNGKGSGGGGFGY